MTDDELLLELRSRFAAVQQRIEAATRRAGRPDHAVSLVAVTKTASSRVMALVQSLGIREFGESRPQEIWRKAELLPSASWHLIGHLQRNKLDRTLPLVSLVHSVDSERLLQAIHEFGTKRNAPVEVLLEVNCSREEGKGGFAPGAVVALSDSLLSRNGVRVRGLMTMAAHYDDPESCRGTFTELRSLRDALQVRLGHTLPTLSMGMSNDFEVAIEEGSTHVRIGSTLFHDLD